MEAVAQSKLASSHDRSYEFPASLALGDPRRVKRGVLDGVRTAGTLNNIDSSKLDGYYRAVFIRPIAERIGPSGLPGISEVALRSCPKTRLRHSSRKHRDVV